MLVRSAEESFRKGLRALQEGEGVKALAQFEAAIRLDRRFRAARPQPRYVSYYGMCLGLSGGRAKEGVDLCREAVTAESYNADLYLNLGRVLLGAGRRREGFEILQRGLRLEPEHHGLRRVLQHMGRRKRPVLPFLSRSNPLNVLLGRMSRPGEIAMARAVRGPA